VAHISCQFGLSLSKIAFDGLRDVGVPHPYAMPFLLGLHVRQLLINL
jgi:hypothetical protein